MAWRDVGDASRSRDALAAVPLDDADYGWARLILARLAAADGDEALARRYMDQAEGAGGRSADAEILALRWDLSRTDDPARARRAARELVHRFPRSFAAARVQALRRAVQTYKALGGGWPLASAPTNKEAR